MIFLLVSGMFCSNFCKNEALRNFHQQEVTLRCIDFTQKILLEALQICDGSFDKLLSLCEDPCLSSQTFFEFDWNDSKNVKNKLHGLLAFNSLQLSPISDELDYVQTHPVLSLFESEREKEIAKTFMIRIARILTVNCYSLDWWSPKKDSDENSLLSSNKMKVGSAILIFGSLFNHSCAPNIDRMIVDNKFVFVVRRPINQGEQLFISYGWVAHHHFQFHQWHFFSTAHHSLENPAILDNGTWKHISTSNVVVKLANRIIHSPPTRLWKRMF